jgi:hypothetical protein
MFARRCNKPIAVDGYEWFRRENREDRVMRTSLFAVVLLSVCIAAFPLFESDVLVCASEEKPRWVDNPREEYPDELYIAGVGSGDTLEKAKDNARAEVAKVIRLDINVQQKIVDTYLETGTGEDLDMKRSTDFVNRVNVATEQSLKNVKIEKTWLLKESAQYYALALIDRKETAAIYAREVKKKDGEVTSYVTSAKEAGNRLAKLAFLRKAIVCAVDRDILSEQLATISGGTVHFTHSISRADLIREKERLSRMTGVQVDLDFGNWDEFPNTLKKVLENNGFRIVNDDPDVVVTGRLAIEKLERKGYFVRWYYELHMKEVASGSEFLTIDDSGREGHRSYPEAEDRAVRTACAQLERDMTRKLDDYFQSLTSR